MSKIKRKKTSLTSKLRNYFIAGVVVLVPIGITLYLTKFFISISSNLIPREINPNSYLPFSIPGLEILLSIIFITLIGGLSVSFIGKRILQFVNDLFKKIPILRTIYSAIGQMTESFAPNSENKKKVLYWFNILGKAVMLLDLLPKITKVRFLIKLIKIW